MRRLNIFHNWSASALQKRIRFFGRNLHCTLKSLHSVENLKFHDFRATSIHFVWHNSSLIFHAQQQSHLKIKRSDNSLSWMVSVNSWKNIIKLGRHHILVSTHKNCRKNHLSTFMLLHHFTPSVWPKILWLAFQK